MNRTLRTLRSLRKTTLPDSFTRTSPFEEDALQKSQWDARYGRAHSPEQRLMLAVLEDTLDQYRRYGRTDGRRAQALAAEAWDWITADDPRWPFSFVRICEALGIDPDYLRRGLTTWAETSGRRLSGARDRSLRCRRMSTQAEVEAGARNPLYAVGRKRGSCAAAQG